MSRLLQAFIHLSRMFAAHARARYTGLSGAEVGAGVYIGPTTEVSIGLTPSRRGMVILGDRTRIDRGVLLHPYGGRIETGIDVYIGPYTTVYGHGGVFIGKDTLVSMHCRILSSNHAVPPCGTIIRSRPDDLRPTSIGCDVWLGAGVTVLGGVIIGDGCVVGAGAVVAKGLSSGAIAMGVPARIVGQRV